MEDAIERIGRDLPDTVLVDLGLPGMSGIEGIRLLHPRYPDLRFLVLTVFDDDRRVFDAICAGAYGYLLKNSTPARIIEAIQEIHHGGAPMSPEIARQVLDLFRSVQAPEGGDRLTPHELRLLRLLVEGHTYRSAAVQVGVTVHGISFHMRRIYDKLQVHSKSEAVAKALRSRLI
jgi:DNA-binding NarL/FixJ family response regulator